jgi:quercetin dioxygenase-like cupin family protein
MQTTSSSATKHERSVIVLGPREGEAVWFLDNLMTIKVRAKDGAPYGVLENELPAGSRTPLHRHDDEDEGFYVLEGTITIFFDGGRTVQASAGSYVHVPRGVAHGLRADTALRLLVLSGADGFVEFVREMGVPAPRRELPPAVEPDVARLGQIAKKYAIEILGPLPE